MKFFFKNLICISVLIAIVFSACQNKNVTVKTEFFTEIPDTSKTHQPNYFYEIKKKLVDELNLQPLEKGTDSLEIRLWTKVEVMRGGRVYVLRNSQNKWMCKEYTYSQKEGYFRNGLSKLEMLTNFTVDSFYVKNISSDINWYVFLKKLEDAKLFDLPDQNDIPGWKNNVCDGLTYSVEYATKNKYKFYSYNCPDVYENDFSECKDMVRILTLFDQEIGLKMWDGFRCRKKQE